MDVVNPSATTFSNQRLLNSLYEGGYVLSDWACWMKQIVRYQDHLEEDQQQAHVKEPVEAIRDQNAAYAPYGEYPNKG